MTAPMQAGALRITSRMITQCCRKQLPSAKQGIKRSSNVMGIFFIRAAPRSGKVAGPERRSPGSNLRRTPGRESIRRGDTQATRMTLTYKSRVVQSIAALAWLLIAGCEAGPDYKRPAAPDVGEYTARPLSTTVVTLNVAGGQAQRFEKGGELPGTGGPCFIPSRSNDLIEQSLANNPDLKAAQAALSVARENVLAQRGAYYPGVTAGFSASRQKQSASLAPVPNYPVVPTSSNTTSSRRK